MRFRNFSIWYGKLPHWRAEGVTYYVTFRHSRALDRWEVGLLLDALRKPDGQKWDLTLACVLPERTELIVRVRQGADGREHELSQIVERAKSRAGKAILKRTGERFSPFYSESYDRIVRDEAELQERWNDILSSPVDAELAEAPEQYPGLWVAEGTYS